MDVIEQLTTTQIPERPKFNINRVYGSMNFDKTYGSGYDDTEVSKLLAERKEAKRQYFISRNRVAVSMKIASSSTYIKARNRRKKL